MGPAFQITTFRAEQLQRLRNVTIHSPGLIQILSGNKRLFWKEKIVTLSGTSLLLCRAASDLSFENVPDKGPFLSRMLSFHCLPPEKLIQLSDQNAFSLEEPVLSGAQSLQETLHLLASINLSTMSKETQQYWLMPLFQQLAENGILHFLFPQKSTPLRHQISQYLSQCPGDAHSLESVATTFSMSRATLIRKLKKEGTQFRDILTEVRLTHALNLMQARQWTVIQLAQMCGYQSEERFSQRFRDRFGLTPVSYMRTVYVR
ncbi:helix-turn-helix transcriptional regulator [Vibrio salinus]|uniref:helix-turn-helix transcriptional regulator n=1 Tax=Vibrio salinus TaxID=2899784 RepID=UPI001E5DD30A|nr:AraC family transcriptional regulator [Vibrio salinus]MCE0495050.1 AraC family transcriptional regulator [Vibrio salinus]